MEARGAPKIPLKILHHDEHLVFPGYDLMVGESYGGQDEENERKPWAVGNVESKEPSHGHGLNSIRKSLYKRHRMRILTAALI